MIRWGVIGAGDVAEHKSGPALRDVEGSELVAIMRRDAGKAVDFARRHGVGHWFVDVPALLAFPEVDAVYIASPHHLHLEHVTAAARAGKRVLCEKPVGANFDEALQIVEVCETHSTPLCVAYYRRFWPVTLALLDLVAEGTIGEVVSAAITLSDHFAGDPQRMWLTSARQSGGGALANSGSHWVDLARFLLGEVEEVSAMNRILAGAEVEHTSAMLMRLRSGALVSYASTWESPAAVNEIVLTGSRGRISVPSLIAGRIILQQAGKDAVVIDRPRTGAVHTELVQALVAAWPANLPSPVPGAEAVAVWRIMRAAYRSHLERRHVRVDEP